MKLIFHGIVQGVGFRPTIYRIAKELNLSGYVLNKGSVVEVVIDKDKELFLEKLNKQLPSIASITKVEEVEDTRSFSDFKILHSKQGTHQSLIPTDVAICPDCVKELFDKNNKRYRYPFINCTVCGARYSLIKNVPYDRERTSMDVFPLCKSCQEEYTDPLNRRYHAQTISCSICGPEYTLYDKDKNRLEEKNKVESFAHAIDNGKIGILKSWGGMHICCDIGETKRFRQWYKRPQKSFAVMLKDIKTAEEYAYISDYEGDLLTNNKKPIVLLEKKKAEEISPGLNTIGVFLPYTAMHHLLFSYLKSDAIILTSANLPGEPMITENNKAFSLNADIYLLHNRGIPNRVDDTVLRTWKQNTFFLRKSRGYVPEPIPVGYSSKILSVGPDENITGSISVDNKIFTTQYIGNSRYYESIEFLEKSLRHMMKLFYDKNLLDAVAMDLHPGYDTRKVAKKFSEEYSAPIFEVQHDWAHAASLLVDNHIDESIVIVIEGLGYGTDKTFWGGEVLYASFNEFKRAGHLGYIPLIGGDKATLDPRRLVYAIFRDQIDYENISENEKNIFSKLIKNSPMSCSMGRYLDALSCFLGICCDRTYNGEPAMKLEKYLAKGNLKYEINEKIKDNVVDFVDYFKQINEYIKDDLSEKQKADIAFSLTDKIVEGLTIIAIASAEKTGVKTIGVSGGVSYDVPIINMINQRVKKAGLKLVVHNNIPNGDGGISVGQNVIAGCKL